MRNSFRTCVNVALVCFTPLASLCTFCRGGLASLQPGCSVVQRPASYICTHDTAAPGENTHVMEAQRYYYLQRCCCQCFARARPTLQRSRTLLVRLPMPSDPLTFPQLCAANQIIATDTYLPLFKCWNKDQSAAGKKGAAGGARKSDGSNKRTAAAGGDQNTANKRRASGTGEGLAAQPIAM